MSNINRNPNDVVQQNAEDNPNEDLVSEPGEQDIEADVAEYMISSKRTPFQKGFIDLGKMFARTVDPFVDWTGVLLTALQMSIIGVLFCVPNDEGPEGPDLANSLFDPCLVRSYVIWLVSREPAVLRMLEEVGEAGDHVYMKTKKTLLNILGILINKGMNEARTDDIKHIKEGIENNFRLKIDRDCLGNFSFPTAEKTDLGYRNDIIGRLLTPIRMSWLNEANRNRLKQEGGMDFSGMECSRPDLTRPRDGFLLGELLFRVFGRIFVSNADIRHAKSRPSHSAAHKAHLFEATISSVVYTVMIAHFALSSEKNWGDGEFPYQVFYTHLRQHCERARERATTEHILGEYNRVFLRQAPTSDEDAIDDADLFALQTPPQSSPEPENPPVNARPSSPGPHMPVTPTHRFSTPGAGRDLGDSPLSNIDDSEGGDNFLQPVPHDSDAEDVGDVGRNRQPASPTPQSRRTPTHRDHDENIGPTNPNDGKGTRTRAKTKATTTAARTRSANLKGKGRADAVAEAPAFGEAKGSKKRGRGAGDEGAQKQPRAVRRKLGESTSSAVNA